MLLNQEQTQADQALLQLGRRLRADGYRFTCVTPATHARNNAREGAERARTLRDVFGWSRPFPPSLLSLDELEQLRTAQVLEEAGERLRAKVRWSNLDDLLLVHSAFPTEASDAVFFGPDSYRFAQVIHDHLQRSPSRVQHAVDIGCGTGIGALIIARAAPHAQVSALDINPLALRYTAINAALAGVGNVSVEPSDLLDGVSGTFDLIVANPPYMLDAGQRVYRHGGGALGAQLSLRIVEQACQRLAPGGTLLLYTGVAIVEGRDALLDAIRLRLAGPQWSWVYREVDPDVFGEQLLEPGYQQVERIAAVAFSVTRSG
ncbi:class I SAM-dependent methyltransferase [Pseudomonas sp. S 311-6]|uniref:methyltransferase n=1 Tax=Pseudomonas TaxID=286 RepID=UPI0020973066|nr:MULTISPECIES: class I SAM-dependent methyltransferase [Pseudomonas]MCO7637447.1 class I SAM-dependent methyltransferase [Pseudomonas sp. S 311-6]MCO7564049.1 class I SAM-dependent methyltransferase [Pseudomonas mosselii]MCO7593919.1 class I SAM-dependent methyltransferase [Pseudomonas guariconensis]MCO7615452.1 class I SAM-dependent methyltransferase [Pseudomonas guariconensis]MCU7219473.1 class I SAM-dependent methyltransferase [Pseudomonas brassicacearum]